MNEKEISIKLLLEDKEALSRLNSALKQIDEVSGRSSSNISMSWANAAGAFYIAQNALRPLIGFMTDAVRAAAEQEAAISALNVALENQGVTVAGIVDVYADMASEMQKSTAFSDEAILQSMQTLTTFGNVGPAMIERVTRAALDLATAKRVDLKTATDALAKAANGNTAQLERMGIAIADNIPKADRLTAALEGVESKTSGAATEALNVFDGATKRLGNSWGEVMEQLGMFVTESPTVQAGMKGMAENADKLADAMKRLREEQPDAIGDAIGNTFNTLIRDFGIMQGPAALGMVGGRMLTDRFFGTKEENVARVVETSKAIDAAKTLALGQHQKDGNAQDSAKRLETTTKLLEDENNLYLEKEFQKINSLREMWLMWNNEKTAAAMIQMDSEAAYLQLAIETQKQAHVSMWTVVGKAKDTFTAGIADMFKGMMRGTTTVQEAFEQLGFKMVDILIDYGVQMAVNQALSKAFMTSAAAASAATGAAVAAAWAPGAANASLATFGANSGPAMAGIGQTHALTRALSIPGLEDGGDIRRAGAVMVGESGPELLELPTGARVTPLNNGGGNVMISVNVTINNPLYAPGDLSDQIAKDIGPKISEYIEKEARRL